ncbi:MAG: biotin/lipoyl-binding protein [Bacteroidales bacterium]|jgi:biotin carboxyl carrier protein|nr:biotin/lipoyl-binding protein [Bacteroidales bacterium]
MRKFKFTINGSNFEVSVNEVEQNAAEIEVNGTPFKVEFEKPDKAAQMGISKVAGTVEPITVPTKPAAASTIKAPLPGSVLKVSVAAGQSIKRGDVLVVLESMKMENNILAERDAVVKTVHIQAGQTVMQGDALVELQ